MAEGRAAREEERAEGLARENRELGGRLREQEARLGEREAAVATLEGEVAELLGRLNLLQVLPFLLLLLLMGYCVPSCLSFIPGSNILIKGDNFVKLD